MEGITISSLGAVYVPSALQSVTITAHGQMQEQSFALCCPRDAAVCRALCQPQLTREIRGGSRGCLLGLSARTRSWAVPIVPGDAEHHQKSHTCSLCRCAKNQTTLYFGLTNAQRKKTTKRRE